MKNLLLTFVFAFVAGMTLTFIARATWFAPEHPITPMDTPPGPPPMVDTSARTDPNPRPAAEHASGDHSAGQKTSAETPAPSGLDATSKQAVNTQCTICGMEVDPSLPMAAYQGKWVGFGCKACPPKFVRDPEKYGPNALLDKITP